MSQQIRILDKTFVANVDLRAKQYYIMKLTGSGTPFGVQLASSSSGIHLGVLQNEPGVGEEAVVRLIGTTKLIIGTPIAVNALIGTDSAGKADTADTDKDFVLGIALEVGSTDGDIIEILLDRCKASI